ncbi:MAG: hypothetical protein GY937_25570 [bacterium]|nr:hypothetical protein [bacterium]
MATVDLSRDATQPLKHYAGVRMQQGRVLTDDDFNEAAALDAEGARLALIDLVGPCGSPDDGFKVEGPPAAVGGLVDLTLKAGTMYVGGLRVGIEADIRLSDQPDFLLQRTADRARDGGRDGDLIYLEVWQQPVSAVEDGELFEEALGGPDTSQRVRTMARVRMVGVDDTTCSGAWSELTAQLQTDGRGGWKADTAALDNDLRLVVDFDETGDEEDLCAPEIAEGYLGARNTAIRVQLVDPTGTGSAAALTWGYDNGAPLYRVSINTAVAPPRTTITFLTEPKDQAHWPLADQHIELVPLSAILDPNRELVGEGHGRCEEQAGGELLSVGHGHLAPVVTGYDPTSRTIIVDGHPPAGFNALAAAHAEAALDDQGDPRDFECFLRLWDRGTDLGSDPRIGITPGGAAVTLGNTGITVQLNGSDVGADAHWIIAARPHTPSQVVPWDLQHADGRAPHGVTTYLCPLAVIDWTGAPDVRDCRETFRPLTRIKTCCTVTVGDGEVSHGDYTSIQKAIDELPPEGGEVCVLPGTYTDPITIRDRRDIRVHGCGDRSLIEVSAGATTPAVFVVDSERITLDGLKVVAREFWCVRVAEDRDSTRSVTIENCTMQARDYGAVTFDDGATLTLAGSHLRAEGLPEDPEPGSPAGRIPLVWTQGVNVRITGNTITAEEGESPIRRGAGGVRIAGNSADVWVVDNGISGGNGAGITLGSVTTEEVSGDFPGWFWGWGFYYWYWEDGCLKLGYRPGGWRDPDDEVVLVSEGILEDVEIRRNRIRDMGADGIAVAWFFDDVDGNGFPDDTIFVDDLRISGNVITNCCRGEFVEISDYLTNNVSHGGITLADVNRLHIHRNEINDNGAGRDVALAVISTWLASGVVIEHVHAENNGSGTVTPDNEFAGGVILRVVLPVFESAGRWSGLDALTMHDNRISVPQGRPLTTVAYGPVSVQSNVLTSLRVRDAVGAGGLGTGILLLNLGGWGEDFGGTTKPPASGGEAGLVHFVDNQVTVGGSAEADSGPLLFQHLLASMDSVSAHGNTFRADLSRTLIVFDVWGLARAVQGGNNRVVETPRGALFSMLWWGTFASELTTNMATHCFLRIDPVEGADSGHRNRSIYDGWAATDDAELRCDALVKALGALLFRLDGDRGQTRAANDAIRKVVRL